MALSKYWYSRSKGNKRTTTRSYAIGLYSSQYSKLFLASYRPHPKDGEGTVFSLSVHTSTGVTPIWMTGVPHPRSGQGYQVPHPRSRWGYPIPGQDRTILLPGVPPSQVRGVPHSTDRRGTPSKIRMGGTPSC